jgi:hypothetical protein
LLFHKKNPGWASRTGFLVQWSSQLWQIVIAASYKGRNASRIGVEQHIGAEKNRAP